MPPSSSPPRIGVAAAPAAHHHHRSISVRDHHPHHPLPPIKRSSSVSNLPASPPPPPLQIGSTGSIFALLHRDISTRSSPPPPPIIPASAPLHPSSKTFYIWHNRLWLFPDKPPRSDPKPPTLQRSTASKQPSTAPLPNSKLPSWKKLLKKLAIRGTNKQKKKAVDHNTHSRQPLHPNPAPPNNTTTPSPASSQSSPCQQQLTSPIWERRNFAQITPLNLSHLPTVRLRHKYGKPA